MQNLAQAATRLRGGFDTGTIRDQIASQGIEVTVSVNAVPYIKPVVF